MRVAGIVFVALAVLLCSERASAEHNCFDDQRDLLTLSYVEFNAIVVNGWSLEYSVLQLARSAIPQHCEKQIANWMALYRERNASLIEPHELRGMLVEEAERRAMLGEYGPALDLFTRSRDVGRSPAGDAFIDAHIAFLKNDMRGLFSARRRLMETPPPLDWEQSRQSAWRVARVRLTWPGGRSQVDVMVECFGKPYRALYQARCLGRLKAGERLPFYK